MDRQRNNWAYDKAASVIYIWCCSGMTLRDIIYQCNRSLKGSPACNIYHCDVYKYIIEIAEYKLAMQYG